MILIAFGLVRSLDPLPVETLRLAVFDLYQRYHPRVDAQRQTVIVDIDEKSLAALGQWPWPRTHLARLTNNLMAYGAVVVGFDAVFPEPDRLSPDQFATTAGLNAEATAILKALPNNDVAFAEVLSRGRVVLGQATSINAQSSDRKPKKPAVALLGEKPHRFLKDFRGVVRNIAPLEDAVAGVGMFSLDPESDGVVRRVPAVIKVDKVLYPALTIEMLRIATQQKAYAIRAGPYGIQSVHVGPFQIPTDKFGRIWVNFARQDPSRYVSAVDVFTATAPPELIKNKLVLVGTSAEGLKDLRHTPVDNFLPGVEVHANVLDTVLSKAYLERPLDVEGMEISGALVAGLLILLLVPMVGARWTLAVLVVLLGALGGGSWYMYTEERLLLDVTYPGLSTFGLYVLLTYVGYSREAAQRRQIRGAFGQYLSPALVEQLAEEPERLKLGGTMREMTLMFTDVRDFTAISERFKRDPEGLTSLINAVLTPLTDLILRHDGTIDKYMGDCIMAFWNAPLDDAEHARHACRAALSMVASLAGLNERLRAQAEAEGATYHPIRVGIGLNTGECCVGNVGSQHRFDYSALGDTVNLAARLEGQSKNYGIVTVMGAGTRQAAPEFAALELDLITVQGKTEAVTIHGLLGDEAMSASESFQALNEAHDQMLAAYRGQEWGNARALAARRRALDGSAAGLYDLYDDRINQYEADPPPPDWDGVYIATSK